MISLNKGDLREENHRAFGKEHVGGIPDAGRSIQLFASPSAESTGAVAGNRGVQSPGAATDKLAAYLKERRRQKDSMPGGAELGGDFIPYLADSIFVLFLTTLLIKEPVAIIKNSLIEMAGGTLQDHHKRSYFEEVVHQNMPTHILVEDVFISKNGSQYIILVYITTYQPSYLKKEIIDTKNQIARILQKDHPHLSLEMIPEGKAV
ncbi:hypothetical protein [Anoxynatronum sibiricum]|uniref:Uncharacterized protein n=1 Tax=Anoxynatronum sibiricum TaxID=210623 RepID=A0ABU9VW61_9CLOT